MGKARSLLFLIIFAAALFAVVSSPVKEAEPVPDPTAEPTPVPTATPIPDNLLEYDEGRWVMVEYGEGSGTAIDASRFATPDKKTNEDLVQFVLQAWENRWGYVWGTVGEVLTEYLLQDKLEQYPETVGAYEDFIRENWLNGRTADCVGLIKAYGWYDPDSGDIVYGYGAMKDMDTEDMFEAAAVTGPIDTLPEIPGVIVYAPGHVGVYIGNGEVIEAISTNGGVVKTKLADRGFTHWMECPYIEY